MRRWLHWCHVADHPGDVLAKSSRGTDPIEACRDELAVIVDHHRGVVDGRVAA